MNQTGLSFAPGSKLTSRELNILNDKINELVRTVNLLLSDRVNVNIEILKNTNPVTLEEAISEVPESRRTPGITVKFKKTDTEWSAWVWTGTGEWEDIGSWMEVSMTSDIIDGGIIE